MIAMVAGIATVIDKSSGALFDPRPAVKPTIYIKAGNKCILQAFFATNGAMRRVPGLQHPIDFEERDVPMLEALQIEKAMKACGAQIIQVK